MLGLMAWIAIQAATPSPEAEALGHRIAASGALAAIFPLIAAKETEELVAEHAAWSDADKAAVREAGRQVQAETSAKLIDALGHGYAAKLSLDDLRALAAFYESPAAQHFRAAEPAALTGLAGVLGNFDYKGSVRKAYCAKTGKACDWK